MFHSFKIVHFADLHLDARFAWAGAHSDSARRRRQGLRDTLRRIVELAKDAKADAVLCGGDLYEHKRTTPDTAAFLKDAFAQLAPSRVFLAPGNHDLVAENETCPLILDDPVSACDGRRQILILETLLAISATTQIILFTHDDDVLNWGHSHLSEANHSQVLELPSAESGESATGRLGTRIANRFRGTLLSEPFEELRGASVRPLDIP